jgi:hypothetical protein
MSHLFDIINSINQKKQNLFEQGIPEKEYVPFVINKNFSYFSDSIMHANELNKRIHIPKKYQYEYYLKSIRSRKRFSKWFKKHEDRDIELVMKYYNISYKIATEYAKLLNKNQFLQIRQELNEGGVD